jgi:flagellar biosynthesis protein FlhF
MRIKKYVVHSLPEALLEIKQDLGEDAVILETRKVRKKGVFGWLSRKEMIEVIAAQDRQLNGKPILTVQNGRSSSQKEQNHFKGFVAISQESTPDRYSKELGEIKQLVLELTSANQHRWPDALLPIDQLLKQQEVLGTIRLEIMRHLLNRHQVEADVPIDHLARNILEDYLSDFPFRPDQLPRFICFVGPTGVGKTTTVAKLAADLLLNKKKKVGLITSDTYRIAAVDQLKTYAQILNVPLEVVYSSSELKEVLGRLESCDHILMDTAGRNYLESYYIGELKQMLPTDGQVETFLLISMTSKYDDAKQIMNNFLNIPVNRLILTKMDETRSRGIALNLLSEYKLPLAYVTNGQDVPDDIVRPNPGWLANVLMGREIRHERSS